MDLTFMDLLALHVGYVLTSLIIVGVFAALTFGMAFACAAADIAKERRTRRRKESRNA
ncbi:membrane protein [Arthrobacter phage Warda]|uniref:Membrane protein n=2 Tax=Yangvirus TaxID=2733221 RepID=A0AA92N4E6_9CAUD|nr:membrane protein [Arthrobacter phage Warda]YP_010678112.1 membrane protein [Arthrobacter phage Kaylissa]QXO14600.1 membrane protein [Arthrobacter phage Kaylissa]UIW13247.1 membrane protein [Arthrobacter phage Warda]